MDEDSIQDNKATDEALLRASRVRLHAVLEDFGLPRRHPIPGRAPRPLSARDVESIRHFEEALVTMQRRGQDARESSGLLRYSLKQVGLRCADEFLDTLGPDDVVEGYTFDQYQIFRNFRFMEVCGYDLHDIMTYDWMTLYERSQRITGLLLAKVEQVAESGRPTSLEDVPLHYLKERMSEHRQVLQMRCHRLSPLFEGAGRCAGFVYSCSVEFVDEAPERHELRFI